MIIRVKAKRFFILLITVFITYVAYISISIYSYGNINELTRAEDAIVLGAGIEGSKPSPVFEERIKHGIWLYKNKYVDKLIFTGGKSDNSEYSDSSVARNYAIENSVPDEDIFIEDNSKITQENIFYAAQIAYDKNVTTVIIVSDPLHMKRAMLMAKDNNLIAYSSPTPTTKYMSQKTKLPFLAREVFFYIGYKLYRIFLVKNLQNTAAIKFFFGGFVFLSVVAALLKRLSRKPG